MFGPDRKPVPDERPGAAIRLPGPDRGDLEARLTALWEGDPTTLVAVRPEPAVPVRRVLEVAALMLRVAADLGIENPAILLDEIPALPRRELSGLIQAARRPVRDGYELEELPR
jgi:hypothetical protein